MDERSLYGRIDGVVIWHKIVLIEFDYSYYTAIVAVIYTAYGRPILNPKSAATITELSKCLNSLEDDTSV